MWAPPVYDYQKYMTSADAEVWVCRVELAGVGAPLLMSPRRLGPLVTRPCSSLQQAHVEAAETALHYIKVLLMIPNPCAVLCTARRWPSVDGL